MERRELLKMIALLTGVAFVGTDLLLSGCNGPNEPIFSKNDIAFFDEVAETIIPRTTTPGAKDAEVGRFIALYASDCYDLLQQQCLKQGITQLNNTSKKKFNLDFVQLAVGQRLSLLTDIDNEAKKRRSEKDVLPNYFTLMKQLTLLGFFTSKVGATEVLRYLPLPGGYQGCMDYHGETAWA